MSIESMDSGFASLLKQRRDQIVHPSDDGLQLDQAGCAYLGDHFDVPATRLELTGGEPAIETFVVTPGKPIMATGDDDRLIELWQESAQRMADAVVAAAESFGIELIGPGYLTASALPLQLVSHEPHFDDDSTSPLTV